MSPLHVLGVTVLCAGNAACSPQPPTFDLFDARMVMERFAGKPLKGVLFEYEKQRNVCYRDDRNLRLVKHASGVEIEYAELRAPIFVPVQHWNYPAMEKVRVMHVCMQAIQDSPKQSNYATAPSISQKSLYLLSDDQALIHVMAH